MEKESETKIVGEGAARTRSDHIDRARCTIQHQRLESKANQGEAGKVTRSEKFGERKIHDKHDSRNRVDHLTKQAVKRRERERERKTGEPGEESHRWCSKTSCLEERNESGTLKPKEQYGRWKPPAGQPASPSQPTSRADQANVSIPNDRDRILSQRSSQKPTRKRADKANRIQSPITITITITITDHKTFPFLAGTLFRWLD